MHDRKIAQGQNPGPVVPLAMFKKIFWSQNYWFKKSEGNVAKLEMDEEEISFIASFSVSTANAVTLTSGGWENWNPIYKNSTNKHVKRNLTNQICENEKTKRNVVFDCVDYQPLGATYHCNTPLGHHPFISTPVKFCSLFLKLNSDNVLYILYISGCYLFLRALCFFMFS